MVEVRRRSLGRRRRLIRRWRRRLGGRRPWWWPNGPMRVKALRMSGLGGNSRPWVV
jgi:hypothetical protein